MSKRVFVRLTPAEIEQVQRLAEVERRHPCDQAALLIAEALRLRPSPIETPKRAELQAVAS